MRNKEQTKEYREKNWPALVVWHREHRRKKRLEKATRPMPEDGLCECCGQGARRLVFDHCHATDKFRGWLCDNCNSGLGSFKDDIERFKKTILYLERFQSGLSD